MKTLKNSILATSAALFIAVSIGCSASDPAEREADRLEDKADQVRKQDKLNREATEKAGEAAADRKEDQADQLRKDSEKQADRMEDDADRVRKATDK